MTERIGPGKYQTAPQDWGLTKTKNGFLQAWIKFDIGITYYGVLKTVENQEYVAKNLVTCGFKKSSLEQLNDGDALDMTKQVEIVVENEEYNGKVTAKVLWINGPRPKMEVNEIKKFNIDMRGAFAKARNDDKTDKGEAGQGFTDNDIPF